MPCFLVSALVTFGCVAALLTVAMSNFRGFHDSRVAPVFQSVRRLIAASFAGVFATIATLLLLTTSAPGSDKPDKPTDKTPGHSSKADRVLHSGEIHRSVDPVVALINQQIRQAWQENQIVASPVADDEEWLRRVSLDLHGHIPFWKEIDRFRKDKNPNKRAALVDKMLDDPAFVRNWTTLWTNLTIGRKTAAASQSSRHGKVFPRVVCPEPAVERDRLRSGGSAEGRSDENGAVNFLFAQMATRDEVVLATAKTTRLFMGVQVQCTQCHNHPFDPWKQAQFWQLNSFLRQTRPIEHRSLESRDRSAHDRLRRTRPHRFLRSRVLRKTQRRDAGRLSDLF